LTPRFDTIDTTSREVNTINSKEKSAYLSLRERDVDGNHYNGQDDGQDQQLPHNLTPSLRLHRVALLQDVEAGVETTVGQELIVGANFCDAAVFDHEDLVHVSNQP
jgi:hypothetical protein